MNKFKATNIHFLLSCCIVLTVLITMYLLWYPSQYFKLMGGLTLIVTLACVDIFLGPLLTFVVFKSGKKSLKFDLLCIALLQLAALSYGVYVMFQARPVFTVFNKNQFEIAAVVDISVEELAKARQPEFRKLSITGPKLVGIYTPDKKNKYEWMFAMIESDMAYRYPRLFDDYNLHRKAVIKAGRPLQELYTDNAENKAVVDDFILDKKRPENDFLALPISSELLQMTAIVDAKTADIVGIIDAVLPAPLKVDIVKSASVASMQCNEIEV